MGWRHPAQSIWLAPRDGLRSYSIAYAIRPCFQGKVFLFRISKAIVDFDYFTLGMAAPGVTLSTISCVLNHAEGGVTKFKIALDMRKRNALHWKCGPVA